MPMRCARAGLILTLAALLVLKTPMRDRRRSDVGQAFEFSSVQSFDVGEAKIHTHPSNGGNISIQGREGGPADDLTEPFGPASLPAPSGVS